MLTDLEKARAKSLAAHFKKMSSHHTAMASHHEKMAAAHHGHSEHHDGQMGKAEDSGHAHHKASSAFHKAMGGHHEKCMKTHTATAAHHDAMATAHASGDAEKIAKASGFELADLAETTAQPVVKTTPETPAAGTPATPATPAAATSTTTDEPGEGMDSNIEKAVSTGLNTAVTQALDNVLKSPDFAKKIEERIAEQILGKLPAKTEVKSFAVPRNGEVTSADGVINKTSVPSETVDAEFSHLVKTEDVA